jgi:hypothetical protein
LQGKLGKSGYGKGIAAIAGNVETWDRDFYLVSTIVWVFAKETILLCN